MLTQVYTKKTVIMFIERSKTQVDEFHEKRKLEKENRKFTIVGKASNQ